MSFILASGSATRRLLLANAGLHFDVVPAELDERAAEAPLLEAGATPADLASALAMAKAILVSEPRPDALVVGADQTLDLDGERLVKPRDMDEARTQLLRLSGQTHRVHSAVACARAGAVVWHDLRSASLTMRPLEPAYVGRYLAEAGAAALDSVGGYQLEGTGVRLFEAIDGDFFTVLGVPLLPLLAYLRSVGAIE